MAADPIIVLLWAILVAFVVIVIRLFSPPRLSVSPYQPIIRVNQKKNFNKAHFTFFVKTIFERHRAV